MKKMETIVAVFWMMAFVFLWRAVLPVAGMMEVSLVVSDKINHSMYGS